MTKSFKTRFNYEDEVLLKTDPESRRIVSGFLLRKGSVMIGLMKGEEESWHFDGELCEVKKPVIVKGFKK